MRQRTNSHYYRHCRAGPSILSAMDSISYFAGEDAEYDTNLQVAELNSFTANFAIPCVRSTSAFDADTENELTHCLSHWTRTTSTTGTASEDDPEADSARSRRWTAPHEVHNDGSVHRVHPR